MRSMPSRRCASFLGAPGPASRGAVPLVFFPFPLATLALFCGCAPRADVHPSYGELRPRAVAVARPENRTVHALEAVPFGGPLQRVVTGPRVYNVPALLELELREALNARGYATAGPPPRDLDYSKPLPPDAALPPFGAVLLSSIESWEARTVQPIQVLLRYRLSLYHVPSGELLYCGLFSARVEGHGKPAAGDFLELEIRRSVRRALSALPAGR
jgi:hypothetical protein